jgi:2-octaprenylphenol hydroxylase
VIVGGGLAGLSLACALRDTRLRIALVEQQAPFRPAGWDARVYAVSPANALPAGNRRLEAHGGRADGTDSGHADFGDGGARLDFSAYQSGIPNLAGFSNRR